MSPRDVLARLVVQHAESARLLGADFVPVYRSSAAENWSPREEAAAPRPEPAAPPERQEAIDAAPLLEPKPAAGPTPKQPAAPSFAPGDLIRAKDRATAQAELEALRERYEREAPHARFIQHYNHIVFGEGDPRARLMFIGEAPGAEEDRTGRPFVGPAGKLLDKMIAAMGLTRDQVYIANVLKVRPPNNATPTIEETAASAPYLFEQIRIIGPEVIVALGLPAARALLDTSDSMSRLRGRFHAFTAIPGMSIPVMPTYHPAFLLRQYTPDNRRKVWSDLQQVVERLRTTPR